MIHTRRALLRGALAGPLLAFPALAALAEDGAGRPVPQGTFVLTRQIERVMADGTSIAVIRRWQIRFEPSGRGMQVLGHQISAEVDAPPRLAELAQVERTRPTDGMFPILLSGDGRIFGAGDDREGDAVAEALRIASEMIARVDGPEQATDAALSNLALLQAAGTSLLETLPADLFFPLTGAQDERRALTLPGGEQGDIELHRMASSGADGMLERIERRVISTLGNSRRESRETWSLKRA